MAKQLSVYPVKGYSAPNEESSQTGRAYSPDMSRPSVFLWWPAMASCAFSPSDVANTILCMYSSMPTYGIALCLAVLQLRSICNSSVERW